MNLAFVRDVTDRIKAQFEISPKARQRRGDIIIKGDDVLDGRLLGTGGMMLLPYREKFDRMYEQDSTGHGSVED